jgi:hypothetical protein
MARRLALPVLAALLLIGCESREVEKDLRIVGVNTGWYDAGIVGGMNKLVPSISLELENVSDRQIASVQLNAVFKRMGEDQAWGEHFIRAIDPSGLPAGAKTKSIVLRSTLGYTGAQARGTMLGNREFVDARVEVFGKHGSRTWVKMGEFPIERQLLRASSVSTGSEAEAPSPSQ